MQGANRVSASDIERARVESRQYETTAKAPLYFCSITFIPIVLVVLWVLTPDEFVVVYAIKVYIAGIFLGLLLCDLVAVLLSIHQQALCVIARVVDDRIATSVLHVGAVILAMVVTVTVFFVRSVHSSNYRMGFRRALLRPLLVFIVLYLQVMMSLYLIERFEGHNKWQQLYICLLYLFIVSVYRGFVALLLPNKEREMFQLVAVCLAAFPYRMLFLYVDSWAVFAVALGAELLFKWISYIVHLSNTYFYVSRQFHEFIKRKYLYNRMFVVLESESDVGESNEIDMAQEKIDYHKELSSKFFVQTHADVVFAVGLFVGQAAVLWFTPILTLNYPTLYITRESLIAVSLKYCAAIVLEIANFFGSIAVLRKIGRIHFDPVSMPFSHV